MFHLNRTIAEKIAKEWIESWNSHDLNRILSHYTEDFEMSSPFIPKFAPESGGKLVGKNNVAEYWSQALTKYPDLHFDFLDVYFSVNMVCISYVSILNLRAIEWLTIQEIHEDQDGKVHFIVCRAAGLYNNFPN
jgi:hypothetical protein